MASLSLSLSLSLRRLILLAPQAESAQVWSVDCGAAADIEYVPCNVLDKRQRGREGGRTEGALGQTDTT